MGTRKRVLVAMSGGVDSSVAAVLLKKEGYEVIGVTMRLYDLPLDVVVGSCCAPRDIDDAKAVAHKLEIPHYVFDFREEFMKRVIKPFANEYVVGRTPNPCILCNEKIKFGILLKKALELDAVAVATGHHARIKIHNGKRMVRRGKDEKKDQSYFLYFLTHQTLENVLFPVGDITKNKARSIAKELGLKTAEKAESQEICFVVDGGYGKIVEAYADRVPSYGDIVYKDGSILGKHRGIHHYTVGQRRGLGIGRGKPLYVIELNPTTNEVKVGFREESLSMGLIAEDVVWNAPLPPIQGRAISVKIRHQGNFLTAFIFPNSKKEFKVVFDSPHPAVTPGQAAVFYDGELVLGGGWIKSRIEPN